MGMIAKGISGLVGTYSEVTAGQAQMEQDMQDRKLAMFKATDAIMRGDTAASFKTAEGTQRIGHIDDSAAKGNVDVEASGSVVRGKEDTASANAFDVLSLRSNAARSAFGFQQQARDKDVAIEKWKHDSVLVPFKNVLSVFGGGEFNIGGGGNTGGGGNEFLDGKTGADFSPGGAYEGWT